MSEAPLGPEWWQAADLKWYPPESHPNYGAQLPNPPGGAVAGPGWQGNSRQFGGGQLASENLAAAKGFAAKLSPTAWLLAGGFVAAVLSTFFPLVSVGSLQASAPGAAMFAVYLLVAGATAFAWPVFSGSPISVNRLIGLTVVVVLLAALTAKWLSDFSGSVSPGFGFLLLMAAVAAILVGLVRLWLHRSQTPN